MVTRVINEGGWYFASPIWRPPPTHQRLGWGRQVLRHLLDMLRAGGPANPDVTVVADPPGRRLYESMGAIDSDPAQGRELWRPPMCASWRSRP
jgi:hypothetical protein